MGSGWIILEFFNAIFGIYMMLLFSEGLLKSGKTKHTLQTYAVFCIAVVISFVINIYFITDMLTISAKTLVLALIISKVYCKAKNAVSVVCALLFFLMVGVSELLAALLITINPAVEFEAMMETTVHRYYAILLVNFIVFILTKIMTRIRKGSLGTLPLKMWLALILLPLVSVLTTLQITYVNIFAENVYPLLSAFVIVGLLYSNLFIFGIFEGILRRNADREKMGVLEAQLAIQKEHNDKIVKNQTYIQQMHHDFKQYIQAFLHLCNTGKYGELSEKLLLLAQEQQKRIQFTINTGNPMLDAVLTNKKETAESEGIRCIWDFNIPPDLPVPIIDLIALLGNGIDNAAEACQRTPAETEKVIRFSMKTDENALLCEIKNTLGAKPKTEDGKLVTLKKDTKHHGIGLQSMAECCKRLNGQMSYDFDDSMFETRIFIPL
ncbi:MAG: ATP-binding protein [Oscillospiraceae bacterium]|nr:ATP-binding protein [Oscillospiraceae bacterium]